MAGLGIVAFLAVFLWALFLQCTKRNLEFKKFLNQLPLLVIAVYLFSSRSHYAINELILFPLSLEQVYLYLTPQWRHFSLIWIIIALLYMVRRFLLMQAPIQRAAWIDSLFVASASGLIPLGIFLLLGDSFIGLPTQGSLWVSAIKEDSALGIYNQVLPLGGLLSLVWLVSTWWIMLRQHWLRKGFGYLWFSFVALSLCLITVFQIYPRRLIMMLWDVRVDFKQYFLLLVSIGFLIRWYLHSRSMRSTSKTTT